MVKCVVKQKFLVFHFNNKNTIQTEIMMCMKQASDMFHNNISMNAPVFFHPLEVWGSYAELDPEQATNFCSIVFMLVYFSHRNHYFCITILSQPLIIEKNLN